MDIHKMTDEQLAKVFRKLYWEDTTNGGDVGDIVEDDIKVAQFIRQCVKDSTPEGLTVEEIENLLFPYLSKNWLPTIKEIAQEFHAAQKGKGKSYVA